VHLQQTTRTILQPYFQDNLDKLLQETRTISTILFQNTPGGLEQ